MVLTQTELKWYRRMLHPLLSIICSRVADVSRISIGEVGSEVTITCDNRVVASLDNIFFSCKEVDDYLVDCKSELSETVRVFCNKLSYFQTYKIRQIVVKLENGNWNGSIESGETKVSTEKIGERVVILRV